MSAWADQLRAPGLPYDPQGPRWTDGSIWRSWRVWLLLTLETVAFGGLSLSYAYLTAPASAPLSSLFLLFLLRLPQFLVNLLFVPLIWTLNVRWRLDRLPWSRGISFHVVAAIVLALARIALVAAIGIAELNLVDLAALLDPPRTMAEYYQGSLFLTYFVLYWAVVGLYLGFEFYRESEQRLKIAAQLQSQLVEARLQSLRSQLNPHFLFNTLNTISVFALKGERESVVEMIERLSHSLRYALDDSRSQLIALREEMDFLNGYLDIHRIRFVEHLTVSCHIAPETLNALVPALILQPIVENAIEHGVSAVGGGTVTIASCRVDGRLEIQVADNGTGFRPSDANTSQKGLGLALTESRLQALCGSASGIRYRNSADGGAVVTISMPFRVAASGREVLRQAI